ncbi:hypothetical protein [Streptomyces ardesiacus]|uniref:hypothetical protein n=1 Tax=Streptomyces ardesiacus TaxID=285564 RepID=UPI000D59FDE0|nr:hypothetical protein [Streptomyces ardesiacus]
MTSSRATAQRVKRIAIATGCAAALAVTQAAQAHAASRTVSFNYQHLWLTPEFKTGGGPIHFTVKTCNRTSQSMTVLLRRTDGFNYDIGSSTIKCRAGQRAVFDVGSNPAGTYEFELGKLDDGKYLKGTGTYSFTAK